MANSSENKKPLQVLGPDEVVQRILQCVGRAKNGPAFTMIVGAGFSHPVIPTTKAMLELIPRWLWNAAALDAPLPETKVRGFWSEVKSSPLGAGLSIDEKTGQPDLSRGNAVTEAYQAVMSPQCTVGLNSHDLR
ncbi:MAG: hypothetical protein IT463_01955, partial [Planctomycetes bacterium]|nr:hypothetical protein [Planctomycetota bacterium]